MVHDVAPRRATSHGSASATFAVVEVDVVRMHFQACCPSGPKLYAWPAAMVCPIVELTVSVVGAQFIAPAPVFEMVPPQRAWFASMIDTPPLVLSIVIALPAPPVPCRFILVVWQRFATPTMKLKGSPAIA